MKNRSAVSTSVVAIIIIVLVAVAGGSYYYYVTQVAAGPQKTIGVVFDVGGRGDLSFNDMAAPGADNVAAQLFGCSSSSTAPCEQFLTSSNSNDYVTNLQKLASEPNPPVLIVAVGFLMTDAVNQTSRQYPKQNFAIIDGFVPGLPNVLSIQFRTDQGAAVAGALAAYATSCCGGSAHGESHPHRDPDVRVPWGLLSFDIPAPLDDDCAEGVAPGFFAEGLHLRDGRLGGDDGVVDPLGELARCGER